MSGSGVGKHTETSGVWGHAPPGKFQSQRLLLVPSESSFNSQNLALQDCKFIQDSEIYS